MPDTLGIAAAPDRESWRIQEAMTVTDVETILQRTREAFPLARPRIISDNGLQFVARDFGPSSGCVV